MGLKHVFADKFYRKGVCQPPSSIAMVEAVEQRILMSTTPSAVFSDLWQASSIDTSRTFELHSNPGADLTIYLDFDGHTFTTTQHSSIRGKTVGAWDMDNNQGSWSAEEHLHIPRTDGFATNA